jgi:hypothetical protein
MPLGYEFPDLTPSQRVYTPPSYPTNEFQGLNGAVTTIQYGRLAIDSQLQMTFQNIPDEDAWKIVRNYAAVNNEFNSDTGERAYVTFSATAAAMRGIQDPDMRSKIAEDKAQLRYRYLAAPQITSTFPGRSTVTVELRGYLEGAGSV